VSGSHTVDGWLQGRGGCVGVAAGWEQGAGCCTATWEVQEGGSGLLPCCNESSCNRRRDRDWQQKVLGCALALKEPAVDCAYQ
jgi:hypothetical protein